MSLLDPGRLRHRVIFQKPKDNIDGDGNRSTVWQDVVTLWAAVEPLSAREFIASQAVQSKATARIVIRYRAGIDASMRIKHRDSLYNIEGMLPDPDTGLEYITIPVSVGVNQG